MDHVKELEEAGAQGDGDPHDDALADTVNGVDAAPHGGIEEVVGGLLKRGQN